MRDRAIIDKHKADTPKRDSVLGERLSDKYDGGRLVPGSAREFDEGCLRPRRNRNEPKGLGLQDSAIMRATLLKEPNDP